MCLTWGEKIVIFGWINLADFFLVGYCIQLEKHCISKQMLLNPRVNNITTQPYIASELEKDFFCPVFRFSTDDYLNHAFGVFCQNMRHKSK